MHLLLGIFIFLLVSLSYSATANASPTCFTISQNTKPSGHGLSTANKSVDTAIALGSSLYAIPTLGMSLVLGSGTMALHHVGKSIYDETIIEDRKKIARLIAEATHFTETNGGNLSGQNSLGTDREKTTRPNSSWRNEKALNPTKKQRSGGENYSSAEYIELNALLRRLNFPFSSKYKIKQVAALIVAANNDQSFCSNPHVLRPVHFKDYVLSHSNL